MRGTRCSVRRGAALVIVALVVATASVIVLSVQASSKRSSFMGREAVSRVRAKWAARAGVEATLARLGANTENPDLDSVFTMIDDMAEVAQGTLRGARFEVGRTSLDVTEGSIFATAPSVSGSPIDGSPGDYVLGAGDAHAKVNINKMTFENLMTLPEMREDVADAILDWIDEDDDVREQGAEASWYLSERFPYEPRNGPIRSVEELELVAGVERAWVRGEDWNLNGVLDPNEDDGDASWPNDNADGELDPGWSGRITAVSRRGGLAVSGLERLELGEATESDLMQILGVSRRQATTIIARVPNSNSLADFIQTPLDQAVGNVGPGGDQTPTAPPLDEDELGFLLNETSLGDEGAVGKMNINTCPAEVLQYLSFPPELVDPLMLERETRPGGFTSLADLLEIPGMTNAILAQLYDFIDVRSNTYVVTSRGWDERSGLSVEMTVVLDRSALPVTVLEVRIR